MTPPLPSTSWGPHLPLSCLVAATLPAKFPCELLKTIAQVESLKATVARLCQELGITP